MWGTAFVFIRMAVETVPPASVAGGRILVAAALLWGWVRLAGLRFPRSRGLWLRFGVLGVVGNALPFFLISWGQQRIASGLAGILMAVNPLVTLVLAHFFVPGEKMTPARSGGFGLGFLGIIVLIGPEALLELGGSASDLARQGAVLIGATCYAINAILVRRLPETDARVASAGVLVAASLVMVPAGCVVDRPWVLAPQLASLGAVAWLGVVPTAAATLVYFRVIASAGPTFLSLVNYLMPLVALVAGILAYGEEPGVRAAAALALILAGIALAQVRSS